MLTKCYASAAVGGAFMQRKAQRFRLVLLYGAIAVLGAAYGVLEQPQAIDRLANSMKQSLPLMEEMLPFSLLLILALVVYGLFRVACSVLERLNGVSIAPHRSRQTNYGKAR